MRIRFAPRLVPTLAAIAMIALTVSLGRWQVDRGDEKAARQSMFEARAREAPIVLGGSSGPAEALLYRGWIERTDAYPAPPDIAPLPRGPVEVSGLAALPPRRYLELSTQTVAGNVWQNLSLAGY